MSLEAYIPRKRLNIKGKRIRGKISSSKYWIDSTKYLQYKLLPDYIRIVRWDYAIDPLREIVFYVPLSAFARSFYPFEEKRSVLPLHYRGIIFGADEEIRTLAV